VGMEVDGDGGTAEVGGEDVWALEGGQGPSEDPSWPQEDSCPVRPSRLLAAGHGARRALELRAVYARLGEGNLFLGALSAPLTPGLGIPMLMRASMATNPHCGDFDVGATLQYWYEDALEDGGGAWYRVKVLEKRHARGAGGVNRARSMSCGSVSVLLNQDRFVAYIKKDGSFVEEDALEPGWVPLDMHLVPEGVMRVRGNLKPACPRHQAGP